MLVIREGQKERGASPSFDLLLVENVAHERSYAENISVSAHDLESDNGEVENTTGSNVRVVKCHRFQREVLNNDLKSIGLVLE